VWFAEIEPFPSAVLAHHYPDVPNLGDMTRLAARILAGEVEAPDIFVGGTPCQSFSVAGLRKGLADPRGQLTRTFVEILDAIDTVRLARGEPPCIVLWENVPGVLSDKDNAFGNFLAALVGEDCALESPGGRWTDAGLVLGPTRQAAWRILDAQYFGVAQRRRRVFVVVSSRASDVRPVEVLLIEQGVRRDSPPSREAWQGPSASAARSAASGGGERGAGDDGGRERGRGVVAPPLTATNDPSRSPQSSEVTQQVEAVLRATYPELADVVGTLSDGAHHGGGLNGQDAYTGRILPVAFDERQTDVCVYGDKTGPLDTDPGTIGVQLGMCVRRLTPNECERLQGFPDGWTAIPWKRKPAIECPDGPRYRALGNSMAVPVIAWIGDRIDKAAKPSSSPGS
jgi:DNA (cytosine-5)-methyltransferase 1